MNPIRYPQIKSRTEAEQIRELEAWLRGLVDQLNYALQMLENQKEGK